MARMIKIFDTTLRDGEQSPGFSMNLPEKVEMARQLERLGVDIIEAGFPVASPEDFESVKAIAQAVKGVTIAGLCRSVEKDIQVAYDAVKHSDSPRIHVFLATSDVHMKYKLKMTREEVIAKTAAMVGFASSLCPDVEFSAEDAFRSDRDFLVEVLNTAIKAGARTVNIPDTVGYAIPEEYGMFVAYVKNHIILPDEVDVSVHCHNDLGLAVSNSLAAVQAGATQVEGTINGIGERAGNASIEEIVMALGTRKDYFDAVTRISTREIYRTSKLLSNITGQPVAPNKAIVGKNAFAHESGIHQHGVMSERTTYEIMTPESVGVVVGQMVLGKHSGKHAFSQRLVDLGYSLTPQEIEKLFEQFKILADRKKDLTDRDIEALVHSERQFIPEVYALESFVINSGSVISSTATVKLSCEGEILEEVAGGDGPIDAAFKAIDKIIQKNYPLKNYNINAVTGGEDALGEAIVKMQVGNSEVTGRGLSTDILEASIKAYVNAVNKALMEDDARINVKEHAV